MNLKSRLCTHWQWSGLDTSGVGTQLSEEVRAHPYRIAALLTAANANVTQSSRALPLFAGGRPSPHP